ncbi:putative transcription factor interactor and regulator CCHC(Zn) family [Helianthus annuus]|nr:putative transcription factor interactor and regulator CCHC(Zn) family [Helianthus annuus]
MAPKSIVEVTSHTHFPIKLTATNYPSWRKQVMATLVGLGLETFVDGSTSPPQKQLPSDVTKPNPEYTLWFRQDQIILGAILGCCSDSIQHILASADTSKQAFEQLNASFAGTSRSRIISLKSRLAKNPKGTRSMAEFLHDMKAIADELTLAREPVTDEDLIVHIVNQLGDDYANVAAVLKMRDTTITFADLFDKLVDHERTLLEAQSASPVVTVNTAQRFPSRPNGKPNSDSRGTPRFNNNGSRFTKSQPQQGWNNTPSRGNRNSFFCQYCSIPGHDTKECRKLARFLKENNITISIPTSSSPMINTSSARSTSQSTPWAMFDTGATNHAYPEGASLHTLSEYGGPDEVVLGNGSLHGGASHVGEPTSMISIMPPLKVSSNSTRPLQQPIRFSHGITNLDIHQSKFLNCYLKI